MLLSRKTFRDVAMGVDYAATETMHVVAVQDLANESFLIFVTKPATILTGRAQS